MKRPKVPREIPTDPNALLTEEEVAKLIGFSPRTLQAWRNENVELSFVEFGRSIRYRRAVVDDMIQKKTIIVRPRTKTRSLPRGTVKQFGMGAVEGGNAKVDSSET